MEREREKVREEKMTEVAQDLENNTEGGNANLERDGWEYQLGEVARTIQFN